MGAGRDDPWLALLDGARTEAAVAARSRERWLRQQAEEEATLAGTLLDLAEQGAVVTLHRAGGRAVTGAVVAVGRDFCVVRAAGGPATCVALAALIGIRPAGRDRAAGGDRTPPLDLTMGELLARAAPERPAVVLSTADPHPLTGELRVVGVDLLTLVPDGDPRGRLFVPLAAVAEVRFV